MRYFLKIRALGHTYTTVVVGDPSESIILRVVESPEYRAWMEKMETETHKTAGASRKSGRVSKASGTNSKLDYEKILEAGVQYAAFYPGTRKSIANAGVTEDAEGVWRSPKHATKRKPAGMFAMQRVSA
jgi:hypothetical protein